MASPGRHGDSCPICLQLYPPLDKAVISSCLHAFCISCLAAWCERKRACPVCRGSVSSYYHTIQSDIDFLEHVFPAAEAAAAATAGLATAAGQQQQQQQRRGLFDVDALLDLQQEAERLSAAVNSFTARLGIQQLQQQQQQRGETAAVHQDGSSQQVEEAGRVRQPRIQLVQERFTSWGDPEGWMHHVRQGHPQQQAQQQQQQPGRSSSSSSRRDPQQQQQQSGHGSGAAGGSIGRAAQPRPYFWRMQQHMMASLHHPPSSLSSSNAQADAAQSARLSRRAVYLSNRWAKPYEPPAHAPLFASSSRAAAAAGSSRGSDGNSGGGRLPRVSDVALQSWLERELQALLLDQDVTIVCAYVRGLINSFGLQQQQHQGTTVSGFAAASSNGAGSTAEALQQVAAAAPSATAAGLQQQSQGQSLRSAAAPAAADATDPSPQPSGAGTSIPDAAAALQSFLFDHAAHFWHELSCFALSGLTVAAWDRVVQYGPPPGQQRQQQLPLLQPTQRRQQPVVSECAQQQQLLLLQGCHETREPSPQVRSSSGRNGSSRKRTRVGHSGWDVPPAAAAAAAAAVTHLRRPAATAAAAAAAAVAEQHGSADGRAVEQQQQGSGVNGSERHAACSRQGQSHRRSRGVRSRSGSRSRSRSRSRTGRGFRHRNKHYTNHSSGNSRKPSRRHSSSSRSPVGRSQRIARSQQVQGRPTERSWQQQQQQQQQEWAGWVVRGSVRGSAGWQQAVLLKQLGAARGGSWRQQQQQHVPSSERWEME